MNNAINKIIPVFFAVVACSWMPHWSCHYYRLETRSSFVVGRWTFTNLDSYLAILLYSILIIFNFISVNYYKSRFLSALLSGISHVILGILHIVRLIHPFKFEVFGSQWSRAASLRELLVVLPFGICCIIMAIIIKSRGKLNVDVP